MSKTTEGGNVRISVFLTPELSQKLERLAAHDGRTMSGWLRAQVHQAPEPPQKQLELVR
jgi:predicted DNA-binding protein